MKKLIRQFLTWLLTFVQEPKVRTEPPVILENDQVLFSKERLQQVKKSISECPREETVCVSKVEYQPHTLLETIRRGQNEALQQTFADAYDKAVAEDLLINKVVSEVKEKIKKQDEV